MDWEYVSLQVKSSQRAYLRIRTYVGAYAFRAGLCLARVSHSCASPGGLIQPLIGRSLAPNPSFQPKPQPESKPTPRPQVSSHSQSLSQSRGQASRQAGKPAAQPSGPSQQPSPQQVAVQLAARRSIITADWCELMITENKVSTMWMSEF